MENSFPKAAVERLTLDIAVEDDPVSGKQVLGWRAGRGSKKD